MREWKMQFRVKKEYGKGDAKWTLYTRRSPWYKWDYRTYGFAEDILASVADLLDPGVIFDTATVRIEDVKRVLEGKDADAS